VGIGRVESNSESRGSAGYGDDKVVLPYEANGIDLISVTGALGSALIGLGPGKL
jgi:hypothetical protein